MIEFRWDGHSSPFSGRVVLALLLSLCTPVTAQDFPDDVANPYEVLDNPVYSDPVFWWRMTSVPDNVYEPDPYFYWPDAVIKGSPDDFIPAAAKGRNGSAGRPRLIRNS